MSKIAGVRIAHDALEVKLAALGFEAAVVGDDRSLLAAVTGTKECEPEVRERLAEIAGLTFGQVAALALPALPRLPSGKIDYARIRERLDTTRPAPVGDLAEAFRQTFFPHPVRDEDSFAGLGGDSLRHVELSMILDRRLGRVPPGWEEMSVARLARIRPRPGSGYATVGTDLVIRAVAILLVVTQHATLWPTPGGAAAMVVLIGYGFGRFQRQSLIKRDWGRFFRPLLGCSCPIT